VTRKELVAAIREHGISKIYGKTLSRATKKELEAIYRSLSDGLRLPHLSPTSLNMYYTCGLQYYWRYIRGMKIPPNWAMTLGSSVDTAINTGYKAKMDSGADAPADVVTDAFVEDLSARKEETDWEGRKINDVEKQGVQIVKLWADEVQPRREPENVQAKTVVEFEGGVGYCLLTYRDLDIAPHTVIDNKVSGKRRSGPHELEDDLQLQAYSVAYFSEHGVWPEVGLDVLLRQKEPAFQELRHKISPLGIRRFMKLFAAAADAIHKGVFLPVTSRNMAFHRKVCSPESCGYFAVCHKEFI